MTVTTPVLEGSMNGFGLGIYNTSIAAGSLSIVTKFTRIVGVQATYNEAGATTELIATWSGGTITLTGDNVAVTVLVLGFP